MKRKILHITPWFPNSENPFEAIWIKRHIDSLEPHFDQETLHLQVIDGSFKYTHRVEGHLRTVILRTPIRSWRVKEWMTTALLSLILMTYYRYASFDLCNFHIAYPNLLHTRLIKRILEMPFLITEHWSFYHYNFFSNKELKRIKAIFRNEIPLITVSASLERDISSFSGKEQDAHVIPNVVDTELYFAQNKKREEHYLSTAFWKEPKRPFELLEAVKELKDEGKSVALRIGGYGPLWGKMQDYCKEAGIDDQVRFLKRLEPEELAEEMNSCKAFLLPSEYETFSVVCAESLCCGTPVYASDVGAIPELVNATNGKLVQNNWKEVLVAQANYEHGAIAEAAAKKYSKTAVGNKYAALIKELIIDQG